MSEKTPEQINRRSSEPDAWGAGLMAKAEMMRRYDNPKITPFIEKYFNWLALLFVVLLIGGFVVIRYAS